MSKVLALKYRPSSFDKLVGQESVTSTLSSALNQNRLSHAYLFSGLRGSGKTSTARIFAKALVCNEGPTAKPCEVCENCIMANENRHIDIIEMDAASSRKIDDIRDLIEQTKYMPSIARFKIFIIDEVHMLTKEAFNALLKTLEEPPSYVKFILATTDPLKLPVTILSRTQHFRFKQISKDDTLKHLTFILNQENIKFTDEAIEIVARAGNGSLRDTLTLLDQAIIYSNGDLTASNVATMLGLLDPKGLEEIFEVIFSEDRDKLLQISKDLESYECENIIDELISYLKDRYFEQDPKYSTMICERFLRILSEAKSLLFLNARESFILTLVFFKMMNALNMNKVDDDILDLENKMSKDTAPSVKEEQKTTPKPANNQQIINEPTTNTTKGSLFEQLLIKINDRSAMVGECFERNVKFISFKDNNLILVSSAKDNDRQIIRDNFKIIQQLIQEVFGEGTKLTVTQESDEKKESATALKKDEVELPPFERLITMLKSKVPKLGACFEMYVDYVNFQDNILFLNSRADEAARDIIVENFSTLEASVKEIFGAQTKLDVTKVEVSTPQESALSSFDKLITKIYDNSVEAGDCFEKYVSFESFENNVLTLNSSAQNEAREIIRKNFNTIQTIIKEVFGNQTKLEVNQVAKKEIKELSSLTPLITVESLALFEKLTKKIKERNPSLGECFEKCIGFTNFEGNTLHVESCAQGKDKEMLHNNFSEIKRLTKEFYGIDTNYNVINVQNNDVQIEETPIITMELKQEQNETTQESKSQSANFNDHHFVKEAIKKLAPDN